MRRWLLDAFAQTVAEHDTFIEHETVAAPAAVGLRHLFEVFENAALEMLDLVEAAGEQQGTGLFTPDSTGAVHRDAPVLCRIKLACHEILELAETGEAGIDRAGEGAHRD